MELNFDYKIESTDSLNITLLKRSYDKENQPTDNFRPVGYYSNFKDALKAFTKKEILGTGLIQFNIICKKIDELNAKIDEIKGDNE